MADNAILTSRDKAILRGELGPSDYSDYENRIAKIRNRARRRGNVLINELELLLDGGHEDVVMEILNSLDQNIHSLEGAGLADRVDRLEHKLDRIDEQYAEIPEMRDELDEIKQFVP